MNPQTELVRRSQQGDVLAFEELVRSCQQKVFGLIYQILRSPEEVEDVAQEVFTSCTFLYLNFVWIPPFRLGSIESLSTSVMTSCESAGAALTSTTPNFLETRPRPLRVSRRSRKPVFPISGRP